MYHQFILIPDREVIHTVSLSTPPPPPTPHLEDATQFITPNFIRDKIADFLAYNYSESHVSTVQV